MNKLVYMMTLIFTLGCASGEFAGDSGNAIQKKPIKNGKTGGGSGKTSDSDAGKDPSNSLDTDDGGSAKICDPKAMVVDENASESFNSRQAIVNVINAACKSNPLSNDYHIAGAAFNNALTANAICRFRGFKSGTIVRPGRYHSPHDNFIGKWEGPDVSTVADLTKISGKIQRYGATGNNSTIDQLTCKGKLNAACLPKAQEIHCE